MDGKVKAYNLQTGQAIELWPIDARELVARGGWSLAVPPPPVHADPSNDQGAPEPEAKSSASGRRGRGRAAA